MSVPVVHDTAHLGHDPDLASFYGLLAPVVEVPARAEAIRDALAADPAFEPVSPAAHGAEPIIAVHDPGLLAFLEAAWAEWKMQEATAGIPRIIPEVFLHAALVEGMGSPPPEARTSAFGAQAIWVFDASTPIVAGTYAAARAAVDIGLTVTDAVLNGGQLAYGLCRPPGHHAARAALGGFCYLNNAAIAAEYVARRSRARRRVVDAIRAEVVGSSPYSAP